MSLLNSPIAKTKFREFKKNQKAHMETSGSFKDNTQNSYFAGEQSH